MLRYTINRILLMIPTLFVISLLVYLIIDLPPGDYAPSASMAGFAWLVTTTTWSIPAPVASSMINCSAGVAMMGNNSFGTALVTG